MKTLSTLFLCLLSLSLFGATATRIINLPERSSLSANDFLMVDRDAVGVGKVRLSSLASNAVLLSEGVTVKTNLAELAATTTSTNGQVLFVAGHTTPRDWGDLKSFTLDTSATGETNAIHIDNAGGDGLWIHPWNGDAAAFGCVEHASNSASAAIQAALNYAFSNQVSEVTIPAGLMFLDTTVYFPPKVTIRGAGALRSFDYLADTAMSNAVVSGDLNQMRAEANHYGRTILFRKANQTGPIFEFNTNLAGLNSFYATNSLPDGSTVLRYQASSAIKDLVIYGNNINQTTWDQDAIRAENVWDFTVEGCGFVRIKGYAINVFNGNGIFIDRNTSFGSSFWGTKGIMGYDLSDARIRDNYFFGGRGPAIWIDSVSGWRMNVHGNFMGNYDRYGWKDVTSVSTNGVFTTSTDHELQDGTPVILYLGTNSTSTLPSNPITTSTRNVMLWPKVFSSTTFGLHTNHVAVQDGLWLTDLTNGTAPYLVGPGYASGIMLGDGARQIVVTDNRFDQNYDYGIVLAGARGNSIMGNVGAQNGYMTLTGAVTDRTDRTNSANILLTGAGSRTASDNLILGNLLGQADFGIALESGAANNDIAFNEPDYSELLATAPIWYDSTATQDINPIRFGYASNLAARTTLRIYGGSSGASILKLNRPEVSEVGFALSGTATRPALIFTDTINNVQIGHFDGTSATIPGIAAGAYGNVASPRSGYLRGGENASETDTAGGITYIDSGRGSGTNDGNAYLSFRVAVPGAVSGTTLQSLSEAMRADYTTNSALTTTMFRLGAEGAYGRLRVSGTNVYWEVVP